MSTAHVLTAKVHAEKPRTGIDPASARKLSEGLARSLAETYVLYVKSQGFHWNVVGPLFYGLHKLTEQQYAELGGAADKIAERIRALGHPAPASMGEFIKLSAIEESTGRVSADEMVGTLVADHETAARTFRELTSLAERANDAATADLLTERMRVHEEAAWMLRSIAAN